MERYYNDGTEPDVLPHWSGPTRCTGNCNQGRTCTCCQPVAAEACTELGHREDRGDITRVADWFVALLLVISAWASALVLAQMLRWCGL